MPKILFQDMIVKINNLTVKTDPEYLISKVTLRDEFGQTVVDVDSNIVKDIGTNAYVSCDRNKKSFQSIW